MNFDNLVEDAEKRGANLYRDPNGDIVIAVDELKALLTQYILADRAQGQEPVGYVTPDFKEIMELRDGATLMVDEITELHKVPLFTHAQPTPAQIAELKLAEQQIADLMADVNRLGHEKEGLRKGFSECFTFWMDGANPNYNAVSIHKFQDILCNAVLNATDEEIMKDEPL